MADFNLAVEKLLALEGGYSPSDSTAGAVNYGITERFLRLIGDRRDVRGLTRAEAVELYRKHFWDRYHLGLFADQRLAEAVFVSIVNVSPVVVLNALASATGVPRPLSRASKLRGEEANRARERFKEAMASYYTRLASSKPELYARYLEGWKARLASI